MREIKFRAWYQKNRRMYQVMMVDFFRGKIALWYDNESTILAKRKTDSLVCDLAEVVLCQFTGLKDEKDKEIYERDIVKDTENNLWIIEWCDQEIGFRLYRAFFTPIYKRDRELSALVDWTGLEIVGNVHENSELLEDK